MSIVELVGWSLVHSLWEGAVIALLLFGFLRLVHPRHPTARYLASAIALLLLVILPPLTASTMPGRTTVATIQDPDPNVALVAPTVNQAGTEAERPTSRFMAESPAADSREALEGDGEVRHPDERSRSEFIAALLARVRSAFPWLVALWTVGVLALSLRLLGAWLRARQLRIDGTSAVDPACEKVLERLVAKLGVLRPVRLLQSSILQVPAVIGWLRPVVLIPATLSSGLTIAQLEAILAHELAHIRRHDYLVNLLQALVETLLFYHPAAWWISRQVRQEREHCCDDVAIRACGDRKLYAGALLTLEQHRAIALLPAATGGDLVARIRRIASPSLSHAETSPRWLAALIALASVLSIGAATAVVTPGDGRLEAQDSPSGPRFSERNAQVAPDTVIRHPDPSAPLAERWQWSRQIAATQRFKAFWVGYTIEPMPSIEGSIYIGRLERRGISGSGGLNLRGRITNFGDFTGFNVPGVRLAPLVGGGMPDDVALLFAFVMDDRGRPVLARVHISSLALSVDLEDRPLLWLGDSDDEASMAQVNTLFASAPEDLKQDVVAALGVHGSSGAVPYLARWLEGSENNDVREEAAEWLGYHPDPAALALLSRAARSDRNSDVRREAAEAVAEMRLPAATDTLIALAKDLRDSDARSEAVEGLSERSDARALAAAVEIARNDPSMDIRREAVETLGEFKDAAGFRYLVEIARSDRSRDLRMEAVETLAEVGKPDDALRVLRQIIEEDPDEDIAREAVETLGDLDEPGAVTILRDFARRHPRAAVRQEAIETLSELDSSSETISLLSSIAREDQDEEVQSEALESLGEMGVPETGNLVAEIARNHRKEEVRRGAVEMLAEALEPAAALEKLKEIATSDPSVEVQVEATETMGELPASLAIPVLKDLADHHPAEEVRVEALETLGDLDSDEAMEVVVTVAEGTSSTEIRREAIETLGEHLDHASALKVLARIARANDNAEVQVEAIETIGENLGQDGVAVLEEIARNHANPEVRAEAIESLTEMGATEVVEILVSAATGDPSSDVQEEAVEGLAELDDGAGVSALIRIAREHPNREIRKKALEALSESDDPKARAAIDRMLEQ
jgi:HEAT repeat protein/beta-lactamase regulating signal transducer with metallopeptidase domain